MTPLEANLAVLAERWPVLAAALPQARPLEPLEALAARSGAPTARYGGRLLHSSVDPAREGERLAAGSCAESATAAVILGFGFGYACEALVRARPGLPVLVVEPDPGLFRAALASRPLEALLRSPALRLHVSADVESLAALIAPVAGVESLPLATPCLLRLAAEQSRHGAYFARAAALVVGARDRARVNVNTLQRFGPLWVRNLLRNLVPFLSSPGVGRLEGLFEGLPALVIASGPSLDQVMPRLPELAERCLLVSVDTSLHACLERGVAPDFVVVIDPQYWNSRHLDGTCAPRTLVVAESATHPRALRLAPANAFFMSSLFPLGRLIESFGEHKGELGAGGSVATTAWDLARLLGCRPLVMAGLDLGYPARSTHFRGAFFERRFLTISERTQPAEQHAFAYLTGADPFPVRSNSGAAVLTDRRMAIYAAWFEAQARRHPEARTLSLAREGVRVEGIEPAAIDEVLALPRCREQIDSRLATATLASRRGERPGWGPLREALETMAGELRDALRVARAATTAAARAASGGAQAAAALAELDACDRAMLQLGSRELLSFLMQELIRRVTEEPGGDDPLEATRQVYEQIAASARLHERLLVETLDRLASKGLKPTAGETDL